MSHAPNDYAPNGDAPNGEQAFLDTFNLLYLENHPGIFSGLRLVAEVDLKAYHKFCYTRQTAPVKRLGPDQRIWALVDRASGELVSTLHLTYIHGCMGGAKPGPHQIIQWSYSFTRDDPKYRRQGLSTLLRLTSMRWAQMRGCHYVNSVPLSGSHSNGILQNLGFKRHYDWVMSDDYYILEISDPDKVAELVGSKMARYGLV